MGEAKKRGTKDQRTAAAMGLRESSVAELRAKLSLPSEAEYLGYAVHLEDRDEFLAEISDTEEMLKKIWAKTPELALRFDSISEAIDTSNKCAGSIVVGMFDVGSQIYVFGITEKGK